jgi:hypothetical protein
MVRTRIVRRVLELQSKEKGKTYGTTWNKMVSPGTEDIKIRAELVRKK